jgi:glycosyltransferase involved in cell wall biosynthesis
MRIMFVSHLLPHPLADHASAFWAYEMIRKLSVNHDVSSVSFVRSEEERGHAKYLETYCKRVETVVLPQSFSRKLWARAKLIALTPISVSSSYSRKMRDTIRTMAREDRYDIVQMDHSLMGQYVDAVAGSLTALNVLDLVYVQSRMFSDNLGLSRHKLEWFVDSLLSRRYEIRLYKKFDHVLAVSPKIRDTLLACDPSLRTSVIPVGVNVPKTRRTHDSQKGNRLIFMGAMWRSANIDAIRYFCRSVLPLIREVVPDVTLHVVGGGPSAEVKRVGAESGVTVTGYVEDLQAYYQQSDVSIAPMRISGGVQCKILDAMASGLPVITTSAGNEGIGAEPDVEVVVADTATEFARRTIELLEDGARRTAISERGLEFVTRNFSWDTIMGKLENIYTESVS